MNEDVLLIEDSKEIAELITLHFTESGYKITSCVTAEEGLKYLDHERGNANLIV